MSLDGKGVVRYGCLFNAPSLISVPVVVNRGFIYRIY